jgi:tetratricopeptide (TPR) repeat protein
MRFRLLSSLFAPLLIAASLSGCAKPAAPAAPAATARSCGTPIAGLQAVVSPGGAVLIGDMHGTAEIPRFVGDLVCQAAATGVAVRLGLELPEEEQGRIDAYLGSDGGAAARTALLAGPFWQRSYQDGRSSAAMVQLIESVRVERAAGVAIALFAFDRGAGEGRDQGMAEVILAQRAAAPKDFFVLFAGNLHTRIARGAEHDRSYTPMGVRLREGGMAAISLDVRGSGTAWYCTTADLRTCGAGPIFSKPADGAPRIELAKPEAGGDAHYDGIYAVGTTTASVPAIAPAGTVAAQSQAGRARAAYAAKDYATCAALFTELAQGSEAEAAAPYNAACCHALAGEPDKAFALLDQAVGLGFTDARGLEADTDLGSLHGDPRWGKLKQRMEAARSEAARAGGVNLELLALHDQDQADRQGSYESIDWSKVTPRDVARRKRAAEIVAAGGAKVAADYIHASMIFQHGDSVAEYQEANRLALAAVELDPKNKSARWLAAATEDRALMNQGKPQKYATQFRKEQGKWVLYPVDPSITDAQRAEWNCPSLADAQRQAEELNQTK